jgi:aspartokinase
MDKIRIDGIKLSGELALVHLANHPRPQFALSRGCGLMAANRINMPFVSAACPDGCASWCVEMEDHARTKALLEGTPELEGHARVRPSVGLVSVFPHRSSLRLLGRALQALAGAGVPIHGLTSSLAPLTFVTDYALLEAAASALEACFELPPGQRPIRTHFPVAQSPLRRGDVPEGEGDGPA